jgi:hypothetical protein
MAGKKKTTQIQSSQTRGVKIAIHLSGEAKKNLEFLRLKLLDKQGRKPSPSQVIERLLNNAVADEKVPYPVQ